MTYSIDVQTNTDDFNVIPYIEMLLKLKKKELNNEGDVIRVLVCGDRNWKNMGIIERELIKLPADTIIIHGAARGVDTLAKFVAERIGLKIINDGKGFPADWKRYGRGAGPVRNKQMIDEGKPDLILAFHDDIKNSKGTKNMINRGIEAKKKVILIEKGVEREIISEIS